MELTLQQNYITYLAPFVFTFISSFSLVLLLRRISKKYNLYDLPNKRKIHIKPIGRIGGLGICISFLVTNLALFLFMPTYQSVLSNSNLLISLFVVAFIIFSIGFLDDIFRFSPYSRLFVQALCSIFLWNQGLSIKNIDLYPFLLQERSLDLPNIISLIITFLWVSGIINCINWIDGLDGLCAGITFLILISFGIISFLNQNIFTTIICLTLIASILGFWLHNKYPAKIIMGDGGSNFIGFWISALGIISFQREFNQSYIIDLVTPSLILFIPLFDMVFVIFRRLNNSKFKVFFPDKNHLHHRLIKEGFSHPNTVKIILLSNLIVVVFVISSELLDLMNIYILIPLFFIMYFFLTKLKNSKK